MAPTSSRIRCRHAALGPWWPRDWEPPASDPRFPGLPVPSSNVTITFSNIAAPILNIGTTAAGQQQITFQVPCSVTPSSSVPVTVAVGAGSTPVNVAVNAASPGIFQTQMSDGVFRAVVVRPDGSYVSLQNPARRGETEIAFVTGLGATSPPVGTRRCRCRERRPPCREP